MRDERGRTCLQQMPVGALRPVPSGASSRTLQQRPGADDDTHAGNLTRRFGPPERGEGTQPRGGSPCRWEPVVGAPCMGTLHWNGKTHSPGGTMARIMFI